jgi:tetratricopeptide (TPR) repeat protein
VELDNLGRPAEAVLAYEQAVRLKPSYGAAYTNMGIALARLRRWADALRAYHEAIREQPEFADAHYNCGLALAGLGRWAEALGPSARLSGSIRRTPTRCTTWASC